MYSAQEVLGNLFSTAALASVEHGELQRLKSYLEVNQLQSYRLTILEGYSLGDLTEDCLKDPRLATGERYIKIYTTAPSLKIGRYIAITNPPTITPSTAMIKGSNRLLKPSTRSSTSAS